MGPSLFQMELIPSTPRLPRRETPQLGRNSTTEANVGDVFLVNYRGSGNSWLPARYIQREFKNYGMAQFFVENGRYGHDHGERCHVYVLGVKPFRGMQEGDPISIMSRKCNRCPLTFEEATIQRAYPDNTCDVVYKNGDQKTAVPKEEIAFRFF